MNDEVIEALKTLKRYTTDTDKKRLIDLQIQIRMNELQGEQLSLLVAVQDACRRTQT